MARSHLRRALLAVLPILVTALPSAGQLPWDPDRDWWVWCSIDLEVALREARGEDCIEYNERTRKLEETNAQLDASSAWLRGLGFGGPRVFDAFDMAVPDPERLAEYLGEKAVERAESAQESSDRMARWPGAPDTCAVLVYCASLSLLDVLGHYANRGFLRISTTYDYDGKPATARFTPTHELFHTIQAGYPLGPHPPLAYRWITEGSAEYIQMVRAGVGYEGADFYRYWDDPLHIAPTLTKDDPEFSRWAYGSWQFWDFVGRSLLGRDSGGNQVVYLHDLFQEDLRDNGGLTALDETLRFYGTALWDVYTEFVRQELTIERQCQFRGLGDLSDGCDTNGEDAYHRARLEVSESTPTSSGGRPLEARPYASQAVVLRTKVPEDSVGSLRVWLGEGNDDYWRLIVDGTRTDRPGDAVEGRNQYRAVIPSGEDSVFIRVVNAPEGVVGQGNDVTLEFQLDLLEPCRPQTMEAAMAPDWLELQGMGPFGQMEFGPGGGAMPGMERLSGQASSFIEQMMGRMGEAAPDEGPRLLPLEEYRERYEPYPEMRPASGRLEFGGLVSDGGTACVPPLGTNPTQAPLGGGRATALSMVEQMQQGLDRGGAAPDTSFVTVDQPSSGVQGLDRAFGMMTGAAGTDGDVLIRLFAPNAGTVQTGGLVPAVEHDGVGGWAENATADLVVRLVGVSPQDLREDSTYEAVLYQGPVEGVKPIYWRWSGTRVEGAGAEQGEAPDIPVPEDQLPVFSPPVAFGGRYLDGTVEQLFVEEMSGTLTVTEHRGAEIEGRVSLNGTGRLLTVPMKPPGQAPGSPEESRGAVSISGDFQAPSAKNVLRPRRMIPVQHRLVELGAQEPEWQPIPTPPPPSILLPPMVLESDDPPLPISSSQRPLRFSLLDTEEDREVVGGPTDATGAASPDLVGVDASGLDFRMQLGEEGARSCPAAAAFGSGEAHARLVARTATGEARLDLVVPDGEGTHLLRIDAHDAEVSVIEGRATVSVRDADLQIWSLEGGDPVLCPGAGTFTAQLH